MGIHYIHPEGRDFKALEARLESGDLTLADLREIEDEVLFRVRDKTKDVAKSLFDKIVQKRSALLEKEVVLLDGKGDLLSKIQKLQLIKDFFSPEENVEALSEIAFQAYLLSEESEVTDAARRQLEHLQFGIAFPVIHEVDKDPVHGNFLTRMERIRDDILESGSIAPFFTLSSQVQREIQIHAEG